jgi:predicted nucleic acid-binding protein
MRDWLIDASAAVRISRSPDAATWTNRVERGLVRVAVVTHLELGFTARSRDGLHELVSTSPLSLMPVEYVRPAIEDRAMEVQLALADRGHHRAASVADLIVAATAELSGLTVLHVDSDLELIAEVTGQPLERLAGGW